MNRCEREAAEDEEEETAVRRLVADIVRGQADDEEKTGPGIGAAAPKGIALKWGN